MENILAKKLLSERVHNCQYCGHTEQRDIVSAKVIRNRGLILVPIKQSTNQSIFSKFSKYINYFTGQNLNK